MCDSESCRKRSVQLSQAEFYSSVLEIGEKASELQTFSEQELGFCIEFGAATAL